MSYRNKFITIAPHCSMKRLEEPYLYDIENNELYELSEKAYQLLLKCSRGENVFLKKENEEFIQNCLSENLVALSETLVKRDGIPDPSPIPSLRYIEFQMTDRCNLRCRHCHTGNSLHQDLFFTKILKILREFEEIRGLRLLLSCGKPLLHPHFWGINEVVRDHALTNFPPSRFSHPSQELPSLADWKRKGGSSTVTGPIMT